MSGYNKSYLSPRKNGHTKKNAPSPKVENSNLQTMQVDSYGGILFRPVRTVNYIPAGEYIPVINHNREGVLFPLKRNYNTSAIQKITDNEYSYDEDAALMNALESALSEDEYDIDEDSNQNSFVPVHKYFPMENFNKGLKLAKENLSRFINGKAIYQELGMDYRRGILLYGDPGTGKSQFIYQLSQELIEDHDAIVVRLEERRSLDIFYENIKNSFASFNNRLKVIVIEELADICGSRSNISTLLNLLDSMVLRENVLFLITTNYPNKIPANIVDRPSRLDLLCPIYVKDFNKEFVDAWFEFCMNRPISEKEKKQPWYNETRGELSPAYYKEMFIYSQLHDIEIEEAWRLIKKRKTEIRNDFDRRQGNIGFH